MFFELTIVEILSMVMLVKCFNDVRRFQSLGKVRNTFNLRSTATNNIDFYSNVINDILKDAESRITKKDITRSIFCNVELNCATVEAVGFDMDFTLAQYNQDFDLLAFEGAKRKLVEILRYPKDILDFQYDAALVRRGLIIDKKRGNLLKIDRHKYVRRAYHGMQELSDRRIYNQQAAMFSGNNFACIDTMFSVIDAILFMYLVDYRDRYPDQIAKSYEQIYSDIRQSVDLCHRDGVIKDAVMKEPQKFIIADPDLVPMLQQLKAGGKKVFLLTNSLWEFTNVVMNYLVNGIQLDEQHQVIMDWKDLFDIIIVGGNKPAFLQEDFLSLFAVDTITGNIRNIEDKESIYPSKVGSVSTVLTLGPNKVYQGGCWQDLHHLLQVSYGDRVLYVGDHMYSDILRSKRTLGWRTCLIIPELEAELQVAQQETALQTEVMQLRRLQYDLDEYTDQLRARLTDLYHDSPASLLSTAIKSTTRKRSKSTRSSALNPANQTSATDNDESNNQKILISNLENDLNMALSKSEETKIRLKKMTEEYNRRFNPYWGQLLKAGHQHSRFAKQALDYACLYTSRASNLRFSSPFRAFRPIQDFHPADSFLYDFDYANLQSTLNRSI